MARKYDAVIFGASGFTGVQVCRQAQRLRPFASWAAAGRSAGRLREAVAQLDASAAKPDIIVADVESHDSLVAMAQQARLVVNVTGPFRFLGEGVVRACIEAGTDYVDICGEPEPWPTRKIWSSPLNNAYSELKSTRPWEGQR
ncbi:unnamed protein product [Prorocentrum cordatum]|uniref:Saccharopine dehydrogenase NADP binding domain-containing protein n=1 Tax=Prorocentrum cordatum TaxID=2364126 RepID=A0ABN9QYX1_9DINO|nr:unnamed protein product [Polarella glacialis]